MIKTIDDGTNTKPRNKYPSFIKNLTEYFSEYSSNTSIHGVRYLGEKKRSIIERLVWTMILSVSLYLCVSSIVQTYIKWKTAPVIVTFAKSSTPVWQIPFPAVTICPVTKVIRDKFNYTDAFHKYKEDPSLLTPDELKQFEQISLVCDSHLYTSGSKTISYDTIDYIKSVAPEFLWQCQWVGENRTCDSLITPSLTEEGVCYTFNMLNREDLFTDRVFSGGQFLEHGDRVYDWSLETGYAKHLGSNAFPRRALAAGQKACFSLLMTLYEKDLDYVCKGPLQGFKMLIHNPVEMPRLSQNYFWAPLNQEVVISIAPDMMTTSEGLKDYSPNARQCYFSNERQLKYFKIYTQRNCQVECLANYTLKRCGCVSYYLPHDCGNKICGIGNTLCAKDVQVDMLAKESESEIERHRKRDYSDNEDRCNCLPSCTSVTYNAESSQADFNWQRVFIAYKANLSELPGVQMTRVTIFFKEQQFITSERNELYGPVDFLANCGGLLGVFIGFSLLSIIEVVYFLTLRLFCNIKMYSRNFWSASSDLLNDYKLQ